MVSNKPKTIVKRIGKRLWRAYIQAGKVSKYVGKFKTRVEAYLAADRKLKKFIDNKQEKE